MYSLPNPQNFILEFNLFIDFLKTTNAKFIKMTWIFFLGKFAISHNRNNKLKEREMYWKYH